MDLLESLDKLNSKQLDTKELRDLIYFLNLPINDALVLYTNITNNFLEDPIKKSLVKKEDIKELDLCVLKILVLTTKIMKLFKIRGEHLNVYINNILESRGYVRNEEPYEMNLIMVSDIILNAEINYMNYRWIVDNHREISISLQYLNGFMLRLQTINYHFIQGIRLHRTNIDLAHDNIAEMFINAYALTIQVGVTSDTLINRYEKIPLFK